MRRLSVAVWVVLACGFGVGGGWGQLRARPRAYPGVDAEGGVTTLSAALRAMAEQADVVFLGTVESVRRVGGDGGLSGGVVEVEFRVEGAVRGVSGTSYVLREWGGLWPAGERRYAVGETRLMLLHRPGTTGLSSPVGGMEGAIPVRGVGTRVGEESRPSSAGQTMAGQGEGQQMADLRWIAAKLVRPVRYATGAAGVGGVPLEPGEMRSGVVLGRALERRTEGEPTLVRGVIVRPGGETGAAESAGVSGVTMPVGNLLALLRGWSPEERGGR